MQENVTQGPAQENSVREEHAERSLVLALIPLLALFALLGLNVALYGDDSLSGANQTALIIAAALAAAISLFLGVPWADIQEKILENIRAATPAILILLMVGALVGSWLIGGIVPTSGCHSTIESPESVSLVTPPTTTMAKTRAQHMSNQIAIGFFSEFMEKQLTINN